MASIRFVSPFTKSSHQPPQYPADRPSAMPMVELIACATMPMVSETRAP
ncbi:hypothetical protein ACFSYD_19620 [Paracoccus aerius]